MCEYSCRTFLLARDGEKLEEYLQRLLRPLFSSVHSLSGAEDADKEKEVVLQSERQSGQSDLVVFLSACMKVRVSQGSQIAE